MNHWNNNLKKQQHRLAQECKKIWEGKARWAEITFFPSARLPHDMSFVKVAHSLSQRWKKMCFFQDI